MRTRTHISPNNVTYDDLIKQAEADLRWKQVNYPRLVREQRISAWQAQHNIAAAMGIVTLMRRFKQNPQANLFEEFNKG